MSTHPPAQPAELPVWADPDDAPKLADEFFEHAQEDHGVIDEPDATRVTTGWEREVTLLDDARRGLLDIDAGRTQAADEAIAQRQQNRAAATTRRHPHQR